MQTFLLLIVFSAALSAQIFGPANRVKKGAGEPSSGDCATSGDVGKIYERSDQGDTSSNLRTCSNTGAGTYAWVSGGGGATGPTGPTGAAGATGPTGSVGATGATGTGGTPGGSDTYVQFNDSGTLGGDSGLTYNKTFDILAVLGGLYTGNLGIDFTESDTNPGCSAGVYNIYADLSETKLKKCQNGTVSDLAGTAGATGATGPTGAAGATGATGPTGGGGGASAVTDLTDCKVTVSGATATVAPCRYEYTASDGRNVTAAISGATWAISGGSENGTGRFEIDPNGGSPIIRCIYSSGMTASNYTATGCTETSGEEDFSVGTKQLGTVALSSGAWGTVTDVRSMLATHTVTAGTGLSKSGNVLSLGTFTLKTKIALPLVACAGTTGTLMWDTNATLAPTATCSAGSTETAMIRGTADWPDSDGDYSVQTAFLMPDDWDTTSNLDAILLWRTSATSGDVVWQVQVACRADGEVDDVAWSTNTTTVTDTAKGTTLQLNSATITNIAKAGCAAGELMHVRVLRNRTHASDTLAAVASLGHVELTARRSITQ